MEINPLFAALILPYVHCCTELLTNIRHYSLKDSIFSLVYMIDT